MLPPSLPALLLLLLLLLLLSVGSVDSMTVKWLSLGQLHSQRNRLIRENPVQLCRRTWRQGMMERRQYKVCKQFARRRGDSKLLLVAARAAHIAVQQCQQHTRYFRWNCSALNQLPALPSELTEQTKEQALVHALAAAVLTEELANSCSKERNSLCPCSNDNPSWAAMAKKLQRFEILYEGCNANLAAAKEMAKQFLGVSGGRKKNKNKNKNKIMNKNKEKKKDNRRRRRGRRRLRLRRRRRRRGRRERARISPARRQLLRSRRMLSRHNYRVGIHLTDYNEAVRCRCAGTSAACTVLLCYRTITSDSPLPALAPSYSSVRMHPQTSAGMLLQIYETGMRQASLGKTGFKGYKVPCSQLPIPKTEKEKESARNCRGHTLVTGKVPHSVLLFSTWSKDYCDRTKGRQCIPDDTDAGKRYKIREFGSKRREYLCTTMCCHRGFATERIRVPSGVSGCEARCEMLDSPYRIVCQTCNVTVHLCH